MKRFVPIVLMLFAANAHADLHKWVDAAGNVHYSDAAPPADAKEQQVQIPQAPADATGAAPADKSIFERETDLEKAMKARQEADKKTAQERQQAAAKKQNCENARNALNSLENAPRIATYDASGNRTIMDDSARQQQMEQARKAVSEFCN